MRLPIALLALSAFLMGCQQPATAPQVTPAPRATPTPAVLSAEAIRQSLQASGLPVTQVVIHTTESDPNKLLGRPGQYTVKLTWTDSRAPEEEGRCTIEVFPDDTAMRARATYTATIAATGGIFARYQYLKAERRALLRLPSDLTPAQAAEYEAWLRRL